MKATNNAPSNAHRFNTSPGGRGPSATGSDVLATPSTVNGIRTEYSSTLNNTDPGHTPSRFDTKKPSSRVSLGASRNDGTSDSTSA